MLNTVTSGLPCSALEPQYQGSELRQADAIDVQGCVQGLPTNFEVGGAWTCTSVVDDAFAFDDDATGSSEDSDYESSHARFFGENGGERSTRRGIVVASMIARRATKRQQRRVQKRLLNSAQEREHQQ